MKKILLFITFLSLYCCLKSQTHNAGTMFSGYYDVIPDSLINYQLTPYTSESFGVDLFDDPSRDIEFRARGSVNSGGSSAFIKVASLNPNVYILVGRSDSVYVPANSNWNVTKIAKPLNANDPINPAWAWWSQDTLYMTDHSGYGGGNKNVNDWIGGDKYVGLKYQNGPLITYGWIRVQCKKEDSCYVKDLSHTPVGAGIKVLSATKASIYPNPIQTGFYLKDIDMSSFNTSKLKITDLLGKDVKCYCEVSGNAVRIELDKNTPNGCYFLRYDSEEGKFTKKIVKSTD